MLKSFTIFICAMGVFAVTGCGGPQKKADDTAGTNHTAGSTAPPDSATSPQSGESLYRSEENAAAPPLCTTQDNCLALLHSVSVSSDEGFRIAHILCNQGNTDFCLQDGVVTTPCNDDSPSIATPQCRMACAAGNLEMCNRLLEFAPEVLYQQAYPAFRQFSAPTRLTPLDGTGFDLQALSGAQILVLRVRGDNAIGLVFEYSSAGASRFHQGLLVTFPSATISSNDTALSSPAAFSQAIFTGGQYEPLMQNQPQGAQSCIGSCESDLRIAYNYAAYLVATPESTNALALNCGAVQVIASDNSNGRTWTQVRQITNGIELVAWTSSIFDYNWSLHTCAPRALHHGYQNTNQLDVPPGYIAPNEEQITQLGKKLKKARQLFLLGPSGCERWTVGKQIMRMKQTETAPNGDRLIKTGEYQFAMDSTGFELYSSFRKTERNGTTADVQGGGCSKHFSIVGGNRNEIHLLQSTFGIKGYHPDDVIPFFLNKKSCIQAQKATERIPLDAAAPQPPPIVRRIFEGCSSDALEP